MESPSHVPDRSAPLQEPATITRWLALVLDDLVTVPGTSIRVGLDPVLSLVPWLGTSAGTVLSVATVLDGIRLRMPLPVLARMGANILVDWLIGLVPFLGAFGDVAFRANRRNLRLLRRTVEDREQVRRASVHYWLAAIGIVVGTLVVTLVLAGLLVAWTVGQLARA